MVADTAPERVVMLVGFPIPRRQNRRGMFERCGLRAVEVLDLENACDFLQRLVPDAIVLDSHSAELQRLSGALFRLLALSTRTNDIPKPKVVVLSSTRLSRELRYVYHAAGAVFVPWKSQTLRPLVRIVRHECGLRDDCCSSALTGTVSSRSRWRRVRLTPTE